MHYLIALAGVAMIAHGIIWSAAYMGIPETFERSLLGDLRIGFGLILLALAGISFQLRKPKEKAPPSDTP
jgi:hypothetical protein